MTSRRLGLLLLAAVALFSLGGPIVTHRDFTRIYPDFINAAPSLIPHPSAAEAAAAMARVARRMRAEPSGIVLENGEARATLTSERPIDLRALVYFQRSDAFGPARSLRSSADGRTLDIVAPLKSLWLPLGADANGRDLLARLMLAGRVSLLVGVLGTAVALGIGGVYGLVAGYAGGALDMAMMRAVDALYALPLIFFVILLTAFFGRSFVLIFVAIGAVEWLDMARLTRGQTLSLKSREFVLAARALGDTPAVILGRHIAPNLAGVALAYLGVLAPRVILVESFLSFLGLGVREPLTSVGVLVADGARHLQDAPWLLIAPAGLLVTLLSGLTLAGGAPDARRTAPDMAKALFSIEGLSVAYGSAFVARDVSLSVEPGEVVALVGESGSGKTQTLQAALGLLDARADVRGSARFRGRELIGATRATLDALRGDRVTFVFQEPTSALDPLTRVGAQIAAPIAAHGGRDAWRRALALMDELGIAGGGQRAGAYPHQLSGGERQRVMIAMALANHPDLVIADEPTTALDATVQKRILDGLEERRRTLGLAMILVTHDLRLARRYAARLYVMQAGRIVEAGATAAVFAAPRAAYTKSLIEADPASARRALKADGEEALSCRRLSVAYGRRRAVDDVDLTLRRGRTLAVVGESGSGKSTLARALLRLQPARGEIAWMGRDISRLRGAALRRARAGAQIVFQDPYGALSPRQTIADIVIEGLRAQGRPYSGAAATALAAVGLDPALGGRTPDALSGGQRQRVAIARALALAPAAIVLDEPTSSLDRATQREVIALLDRLQRERGVGYLLITHDLSLARLLADDIIVMCAGQVVERGPAEEVFARPSQAYTRELIEAADLD